MKISLFLSLFGILLLVGCAYQPPVGSYGAMGGYYAPYPAYQPVYRALQPVSPAPIMVPRSVPSGTGYWASAPMPVRRVASAPAPTSPLNFSPQQMDNLERLVELRIDIQRENDRHRREIDRSNDSHLRRWGRLAEGIQDWRDSEDRRGRRRR